VCAVDDIRLRAPSPIIAAARAIGCRRSKASSAIGATNGVGAVADFDPAHDAQRIADV